MEYYYKLGSIICILLFIVFLFILIRNLKHISMFIKQKKLISIGILISMSIICFYNFTYEWPEIFYGGNFIYKMLNDLSLAYIGGAIFYIIESYIPGIEIKNKLNRNIKRNISYLLENMKEPIEYMANECLSEFDIENLLNSDCQYITDNFKTHDISRMVDDYGNHVIAIRLINSYIIKCDYYIDRLCNIIALDLDYELMNILEDIKDSTFHKIYLTMAEANTPKAIEEKKCNFLYEYYLLYKELKNYYNKI